jgi:hypothetical protein
MVNRAATACPDLAVNAGKKANPGKRANRASADPLDLAAHADLLAARPCW